MNMEEETLKASLNCQDFTQTEQKFKLPPWELAGFKEKCLISVMKFFIYLPALVIFALCFALYLLYMLAYVFPLFGEVSLAGVLNWNIEDEESLKITKGLALGGLMTVFAGNLVISLVQVMITSPGYTNELAPPSAEETFSIETRMAPRVCKHCLISKPFRSHHCDHCDRCVLKQDHHNSWLVTCVGSRNFKYFFLSLFYALLSSVVFVSSFWETLCSVLQTRKTRDPLVVLICSSYIFVSLLAIILLIVLVFHVTLIIRGQTSFEFFSKKPLKADFNSNPAFSSILQNFKAALGSNLLLWTVPFGYYKLEETEMVY